MTKLQNTTANNRPGWTAPIIWLLLTVGGAGTPGLAQAHAITGAIFTTTQQGDTVNGNIYATKCGTTGVWLNGGPQGPNPGLPEDDYVFQVTDPSGFTLLSTDAPINRLVHVDSTGRFVSLITAHNSNGLTAPTRITVELCPFANTPNPGGEYKVWLTRISDFVSSSVGNCVLATGKLPWARIATATSASSRDTPRRTISKLRRTVSHRLQSSIRSPVRSSTTPT